MSRDSTQATNQRRMLVLVAGIAVLSGIAGTATALTLDASTLSAEKISLFSGQTEDSDLTIQAFDVQVKGKERIDVRVTVENPSQSAQPHRGNVTVQLLDGQDHVVGDDTKATGSLSPDEEERLTYTFEGPDVVVDYEETFIVVDQSR